MKKLQLPYLLRNTAILISNQENCDKFNEIIISAQFEEKHKIYFENLKVYGGEICARIISPEKILWDSKSLYERKNLKIIDVDTFEDIVEKSGGVNIRAILDVLLENNNMVISVREQPLSNLYHAFGVSKEKYGLLTEELVDMGLMFTEGQRSGIRYTFQYVDGAIYKTLDDVATKIMEKLNISNKPKKSVFVEKTTPKKPRKKKENQLKRLYNVGQVVYIIVDNKPQKGIISNVTGIFDENNEYKLIDCNYVINCPGIGNFQNTKIYTTKEEILLYFKTLLTQL